MANIYNTDPLSTLPTKLSELNDTSIGNPISLQNGDLLQYVAGFPASQKWINRQIGLQQILSINGNAGTYDITNCNRIFMQSAKTPLNGAEYVCASYVDSSFETIDLLGSFTTTNNNTDYDQMEYFYLRRIGNWVEIYGRCFHKINTVDPSQSIAFDIPTIPVPSNNDHYGWVNSQESGSSMIFGISQITQGSTGLIIYWSNQPTGNYWSNFSLSYRISQKNDESHI